MWISITAIHRRQQKQTGFLFPSQTAATQHGTKEADAVSSSLPTAPTACAFAMIKRTCQKPACYMHLTISKKRRMGKSSLCLCKINPSFSFCIEGFWKFSKSLLKTGRLFIILLSQYICFLLLLALLPFSGQLPLKCHPQIWL